MDFTDSKAVNMPRLVVIGGGFAGLKFVKHIDLQKFEVTLIDRNNYHSFAPLFYQVASAGLDPASICFPLRRELRKMHNSNIRYNMGEVRRIDFTHHKVYTVEEEVPYDYLVIAAGTTNNFFGMDSLEKQVYTLKSTAEALRCRNDILDLLERASLETDLKRQRSMLNFVVVGGGPAGVEIAGALGEMKRYVLPREYPSISQANLSITLVEGSKNLLGSMSAESSRQAAVDLDSLMVHVRTGCVLQSFENGEVTLRTGEKLPASMVIWTAGVTSTTFELSGAPADALGHANRFVTDRFCCVKGLENVYAIGDIALMEGDPEYPKGHPQVAQPAIQQGCLLARNLNRLASGNVKSLQEFHYRDKGSMATIGRNKAVADLKFGHMSGFPAWLTWMFIHLMSLLGMRNKITVLVNWIWAYFNYSSSLRLLIHPARFPLRRRWGE